MSQDESRTKLLYTEFVTHDVKSFIVERPSDYSFEPGQAAELAIDSPEWAEEKRPFTFTSDAHAPALQFILKGYPQHQGVTQALHELEPGAELLLGPSWGTITYRGPGVFIAGGAGVTPFIAILRDLHRRNDIAGNALFFSNKTAADIILEQEFQWIFRKNSDQLVFTLTRDKRAGCTEGRIDRDFIADRVNDFSRPFYVCGPPEFVESIKDDLRSLGASADSLVFEE